MRWRTTTFLALLTLVLAQACGDATPAPMGVADVGGDVEDEDAPRVLTAPLPLIDPAAWEVVMDEAEDPFADLRPPTVECLEEGYQVEELVGEAVFSVDTWSCNYVTLRQPLLEDIRAGDVLLGRVWHFDLTAREEDVSGYAAYAIDGERLWEQTVPIPGPSGLLLPGWTASEGVSAGTLIYFHLNNHGANSWSVIDLNVEPDAADGGG